MSSCAIDPELVKPINRAGRPSTKNPKLTVNDILFINEYMANGRNGTKAYMSIHPSASYDSARSLAPHILDKPTVIKEIAERVRYETGITRDLIEKSLLKAQQMALDANDYSAYATISMDAAKLAGLLVDKREVKTMNDDELSTIRKVVADAVSSHQN